MNCHRIHCICISAKPVKRSYPMVLVLKDVLRRPNVEIFLSASQLVTGNTASTLKMVGHKSELSVLFFFLFLFLTIHPMLQLESCSGFICGAHFNYRLSA